MTIRHAINNTYYTQKVEEFCTAMALRHLTTVCTYRENTITIVITGNGVNPSTIFEGFEHLFVR